MIETTINKSLISDKWYISRRNPSSDRGEMGDPDTQVSHCIWSCRTERGNYIIQNYGKGDWTWYVATKTNAVSVESYSAAVKACGEHLEGTNDASD